jgi:hypothetical protein
MAVPWLKRLVPGLSPQRPGIAPGSIHVGFVLEKMALGQVFLRVLRLSPANIIPPLSPPHELCDSSDQQHIITTWVLSQELHFWPGTLTGNIIIIIRGATSLTNLGRLSSRRWQSFPTAPDGTGLTCGQQIESHSCIFSFPNPAYSSNYSVYPITRLSGPRSRPNSLRKILRSARESNPGPLYL